MKKIVCLFFLLIPLFTIAQPLETIVLENINPNKSQPFGDNIFLGISHSTYPLSALLPTALFIRSLTTSQRSDCYVAYQAAAGLGFSMAVTFGLKYAFHRTRPGERYTSIYPKLTKDSPSFPSGHTSAAFATATSLSLIFPKWYVITPAFVWASAVGYSRLYMGIHYPSDVLASVVIGMASSWLSYKINKRFFRKPTSDCFPTRQSE